MLSQFEKRIAGFIEEWGLLGSSDKILLAVSGGADSTALLYAMHALVGEGVLTAELLCAHLNHGLRGAEADADEQFVIEQAAELNLAVHTRRLDVRGVARRNKLSIETAARQLRMEALKGIAAKEGCKRIATAHQKNDNAETILQRLARGTGFRGLGGIWPMRTFDDGVTFVRPLLCARRDEIIQYLEQRGLKWRRDRTNDDCTYRRNYIRHKLLPVLEQRGGASVVEQLFELSRSARGFYSSICNRADELWPSVADCTGYTVTLDLEIFTAESQPVKVELVRRSLGSLNCGERNLTQFHYEAVLESAGQNVSGRQIELPDGFAVRREYGKLIFAVPKEVVGKAPPYNPSSVTLEVPGRVEFAGHVIEATILSADSADLEQFAADKEGFIERFDLGKLKSPLLLRRRKAGDRFIPLGMTGEKKLGKFLTDRRIGRSAREGVLVVEDNEKIIWLWPVRMSEQAKITPETKKILQLRIIAPPGQ